MRRSSNKLFAQGDLAVKPVDEKLFTNASGQAVQVHGTCNPMVTIGEKAGPQVSGVGQFRAMDAAKPLLSVSRLAEHGWTVTFGILWTTRIIPSAWTQEGTTMTGGVFKMAMDFHWQPVEGLTV